MILLLTIKTCITDRQTYRQTCIWTLQLYDLPGPKGQVGKKYIFKKKSLASKSYYFGKYYLCI